LNENESLERKTYPRARPKEYPALVYRVIEKVRDGTHPSLRAGGRFFRIGKDKVREILNRNGIKFYKKKKKKTVVTPKEIEEMLKFAIEKDQAPEDWKITVFTDEMTMRLNECYPAEIWTRAK